MENNYNAELIKEALEALESSDKDLIISVIKKCILTLPDEVTNAALNKWFLKL